MSDRSALIAAIREAPNDDAPRLIFADWLEEKGDDANVARAAFIRTQIERARLPAHDPRQIDLEARELWLLKEFANAWRGSHFLFKKSRFRRGFIEYVHVHLQHFLHHRRQMLDLEPVRDISLTGWMRATDDLVKRVAACEELRQIETLRIHHQGPHKSPRSNLVILIESPQLTRLKSLRVPMLAINADARRRFERAPVLTRLTELSLPHLDTYPDDPGPWLSDGLPPTPWARLKSLRLTDYMLRRDFIAQLTAAPFWRQLQSLSLILPYSDTANSLVLLGNRLPAGLESLSVVANHGPVDLGDSESFYARLAERPLRRLELQNVPIGATALGNLLGQNSVCNLRELTLQECGVSNEHISNLVDSPGARHLERLHLSQYQGSIGSAAQSFFASENLRSLVNLTLEIPSFWPDGINWLSRNSNWDRLRHLKLTGRGIRPGDVNALLDSPMASRIVRLAIEFDEARIDSEWPNLIERLSELPNLGRLHMVLNKVDDDIRTHLKRLKQRICATMQCYDSETDYHLDCNGLPPLDEDLESIEQTT